jgi:hypothetical protein
MYLDTLLCIDKSEFGQSFDILLWMEGVKEFSYYQI